MSYIVTLLVFNFIKHNQNEIIYSIWYKMKDSKEDF